MNYGCKAAGHTADEVLSIAAASEADSEHPLAKAIVNAAIEGGLTLQKATNFSSSPAIGVQATASGKTVRVGGPRLLDELQEPEISTAVAWKSEGAIILHVALDGKMVGGLKLADATRPESYETVRQLHRQNKQVVMITGDAEAVANKVAKELDIDRVFSGVHPEDKAAKVLQLQKEGQKVAMFGDGVNDAPALAQADVGVAIGAGTDVTIASADVILTSSNPKAVISIIDISHAHLKR